ncbi:hypothetical protein SEPCBS57363_006821, partial [Sporothrix epigloea]
MSNTTPPPMAEKSDSIATAQSRQSTTPEASTRPVTRSQARQGLSADTPIATKVNNADKKGKDSAAATTATATTTIATTATATKTTSTVTGSPTTT